MTAPYDYEALYTKAKLFINRAMDHDFRSFDEQALWAALGLELLAKAALARVSPLLIADPTEEGTNLLIASGLLAGEARFTSVRAKTVFSRCHQAFKPFNQHEAIKIVNNRNEYLHGGGTAFMSIPPHAWWPRFWAQAATLVTALDKDISELVGSDREGIVNSHLKQNAKNIEQRTEALIERARQRLQQNRDGTLPAKIAAEWKSGINLSAQLSHTYHAPCPACGAEGLLEGNEVIDTEVEYIGGADHEYIEVDYETCVTLTISADYFSCSICQLVLDRYELVQRAGLPETFDTEGDSEDLYDGPEYGND